MRTASRDFGGMKFFCIFCPAPVSNIMITIGQVRKSHKLGIFGFSGPFHTSTSGRSVLTLFCVIAILPTASEPLFQNCLRCLPFPLPLENSHEYTSDCGHEFSY